MWWLLYNLRAMRDGPTHHLRFWKVHRYVEEWVGLWTRRYIRKRNMLKYKDRSMQEMPNFLSLLKSWISDSPTGCPSTYLCQKKEKKKEKIRMPVPQSLWYTPALWYPLHTSARRLSWDTPAQQTPPAHTAHIANRRAQSQLSLWRYEQRLPTVEAR